MTSQESKENDMRATVFATLAQLSHRDESGLKNETNDQIEKRLIQIIEGEANTQIHVGSDGLLLDHKISIERQLLLNLGQKFPDEPFTIYFRRTGRQQPVRPGSGPAPVPDQEKPFGLQIKKRPVPGVRQIIAVASGKGGVGKSTVSTNLAVALANHGKKVGLLDADVYGPSGPTMLGISGPVKVSESGKLIPPENHGVRLMSFGFMSDAMHPVIWRGPLVGKAINQFCYDVEWGSLDILVIDLPPGTGDVQLSVMESLPVDGALIVSTPQDVALIDAHKALSMFNTLEVPVLGLVENMAVYHCPSCGHEDHIFGEGGTAEFVRERKIEKIASVPLHASVRMACDTGQPVSLQKTRPQARVFAELAQKTLLALSSRQGQATH